MKALTCLILSAAALALTAVDAVAQTYICDSKAVVGFDRERGYKVTNFSDRRSYRIEVGIDRSRLAMPDDKRAYDQLIDSELQFYKPAGLTVVGHSLTHLCRLKEKSPNAPAIATSRISCEGVTLFVADFNFILDTGLYSMVAGGFEHGGQSWTEVGECRRIN